MTRIRLTQRRKMLNAARTIAESRVADALLPVFHRQRKRLERFLRRANLRKRMNKIETQIIWDYDEGISQDEIRSQIGLGKAHQLMKDEMGQDDWNKWKAALVAALIAALVAEIPIIGDIENGVWMSRGYPPIVFIPQDIIDEVGIRAGINLGDMADATMAGVEKEIVEWYLGNEPFAGLMNRLDKWFNRTRAEVIAQMQMGEAITQVILHSMLTHNWSGWYWDAMGENPCSGPTIVLQGVMYDGCRALHGQKFSVGTPMPPSAAHPRCHCLPTPEM